LRLSGYDSETNERNQANRKQACHESYPRVNSCTD
jgi:hypothetical protein